MRPVHLFFYGTLLGDSAPPPVRHIRHALGIGRGATVRGALFACGTPEGWYPALLAGPGRVHGRVFRVPGDFTRADLSALDAYEDYRVRAPAAGEYRRHDLVAKLAKGGTMLAQAYVWNRRLSHDVVPIPHGDFTRFLAETGLPQYGAAI